MRALVIGMSLLVTACGAIERAFVGGLLEVQSRAVLTQSTFKPDHGEPRHKPCPRIRKASSTMAAAHWRSPQRPLITCTLPRKIAIALRHVRCHSLT